MLLQYKGPMSYDHFVGFVLKGLRQGMSFRRFILAQSEMFEGVLATHLYKWEHWIEMS